MLDHISILTVRNMWRAIVNTWLSIPWKSAIPTVPLSSIVIVAKIKACTVKGTPPLVYATQPTLCRWSRHRRCRHNGQGRFVPKQGEQSGARPACGYYWHSLGFPSHPFGKIPLASAGGVFLAFSEQVWYNAIANNPGWTETCNSSKKALADKTAGVFFYFFRGLKNSNMEVP